MTLSAGFIGLGAMGAPMAHNLYQAGVLAAVWNRTTGRAEAFASEQGVALARSPEDLARRCNVILTCVSADPDLEALSAGRKILIRCGPENTIRIQSILRDYRRELAAGN